MQHRCTSSLSDATGASPSIMHQAHDANMRMVSENKHPHLGARANELE